MIIGDVIPSLGRATSVARRAMWEAALDIRAGSNTVFYIKNCADEDEVSRVLLGKIQTWLQGKEGDVVVLVGPEAEAMPELEGAWHAYARLALTP